MKDKARLVFTRKCERSCSYCPNKAGLIEDAIPVQDADELLNYKELMITGGEPLLEYKKLGLMLKDLMVTARKKGIPFPKIYVYASTWKPEWKGVIQMVDGLVYTLHQDANEKDVEAFETVQDKLKFRLKRFSAWLSVINSVKHRIIINGECWDRILFKPAATGADCIVPADEDLLEWVGT